MLWLITGSDGFIGRNLVDHHDNTGEHVIQFDLVDGHDTRCFSQMERLHPDVVVCLAAISGIDDFNSDLANGLSTNVGGVATASALGVRTIYASSGAVYGGGFCSELSPLKPQNNYGWGKVAGEKFADISLRFSNVYGPRSGHKTSVVHQFIQRVLTNEPCIVQGGDQVRDLVYVGDVVEAIRLAGMSDYQGVLNISSGVGTPIQELPELIQNHCWVEFLPARINDVLVSVLDAELAKVVLNWQAKTTLVEGIEKTMEWYRSVYCEG